MYLTIQNDMKEVAYDEHGIQPDHTIAAVKARMKQVYDWGTTKVRLCVKGNEGVDLLDGCTVASYGIQEGDTLRVFFAKPPLVRYG